MAADLKELIEAMVPKAKRAQPKGGRPKRQIDVAAGPVEALSTARPPKEPAAPRQAMAKRPAQAARKQAMAKPAFNRNRQAMAKRAY